MAKSRKRKPSFDAPAEAAGPSDTAWVYRTEKGASNRRAPKTPAGRVVMDVPPADAASSASAGSRQARKAPPAIEAPPLSAPGDAAAGRAADTERTIGGHAIAERYALYAAAAGLVPMPVIDVAAIAGVQVAMARALAQEYSVPFDREKGRTIVTALAGGVASTATGRSVLKMLVKRIPIAGTVFTVATVPAVASAVTYAVGCVFIAHFEAGGTLDDLDLDESKRQVAGRLAAAPGSA